MNTNSSHVAFFFLTAYFHLGPLRYIVFVVLLILYVLMLFSNALILAIICQNRSLHEPMYIFVCSLFGNGIFGSSIIFPLLLYQILQDVHIVPSEFCYFQTFAIYVYGTVEYFTLSVMSYDPYLAICAPLHYSSRMTRNKTAVMVVMPWLYGCFICLVMIMLSSSLRLCGNVIHKVYCDNFPIVRLACSDTSTLNAYGLVISIVNIFSPLLLILITYLLIFRVCFFGNAQTRRKALSTCMPHVISLMNFGLGLELPGAAVPIDITHGQRGSVLSVSSQHSEPKLFSRGIFLPHCLLLPGTTMLPRFYCPFPILDPFVYGLSISKIRV
ncbi:olfactory receptor 49-like [Boleophthalmus pectinirostris]|uniref:olfactory receptor 49-like n=1 Tax=Boleophthalmus pectinirostris TaxID=150288 RepID=UPI002431107B|nr:olfactory receptor 49-like [Boleophthalmus pectinirostris]